MQFALKRTHDPSKLVGKLSFIDLAGSERGADTYDNARSATPFSPPAPECPTQDTNMQNELAVREQLIPILQSQFQVCLACAA